MRNIQTKNSLENFKDRELLELILANQVLIYRRIKEIEYKIGSDSGEKAKDFGALFMQMEHASSEALRQIEKELKNQ